MATESLKEKVLETIKRYSMIEPGDRVLVALSGGPDSVALLHILKDLQSRLGISLLAAHLNHGIRGEEAEEDARFSKELAESLGIPITIKKADVLNFKSRHKHSLEMAAREVRYHFLTETASALGANKIATGHTANDQAEEVLLNLVRGAGITGLAGIPPVRDDLFVRPLIRCRREEIISFLKERKISFRYDSSNTDMAFLRNRIRHRVIPILKEENPQIVRTLSKTAEIVRDEEEFLDGYTEKILENISVYDRKTRSVKVKIPDILRHYPAVRRRIIRMCIKKLTRKVWGIGFEKIEEIIGMCSRSGERASVELHGNMVAEKYGENLVIRVKPRESDLNYCFPISVPGVYKIADPFDVIISLEYLPSETYLRQAHGTAHWAKLEPCEAIMDADMVNFPLEIRSPCPGDRFVPLGLGGTKKLQDFFVDEKIPRYMRPFIPILQDTDKIIWIIGYRIDDRVKVTPRTKRLLRIKWTEGANKEV